MDVCKAQIHTEVGPNLRKRRTGEVSLISPTREFAGVDLCAIRLVPHRRARGKRYEAITPDYRTVAPDAAVAAVGGEYDIVSTIATSNLVSVSHVLVVDPEWRNTLGEQMRGLGFQPSYLLRRDFVAFSRSLTDAK